LASPWELERRMLRILRRMLERLESEIALGEGEEEALEGAWGFWGAEEILDSRIRELSTGELDPLYTVYDMGEEYLIVVDLPGVDRETINVYVTEDRVAVEARIREELARRALASEFYYYSARRYRGEIRLPEPVDPGSVKVERRGSQLVIRVPKRR
jgi:HSP20 family protein